MAALDLNTTFDGKRNVLVRPGFISVDPSLGLEGGYKDIVFLRLGVGDVQEVKDFDGSTSYTFQPNFGLGVQLKNILVDYALTDIGDQSEALYSHVFSLKASLD